MAPIKDTSEHPQHCFRFPRHGSGHPGPIIMVSWEAPGPHDRDPVARFAAEGGMCLGGKPLNTYLSEALDRTIARWGAIQPGASYADEFAAALQEFLDAVRLGLTAVHRPGVDASYVTLAAALCANAVRAITVIADAAIPRRSDDGGTRRFRLTRHFAGLPRYTADMLPRTMLPFAAGRRLAAVKREAVKDQRLIANIFACEVDAVDAALERTKLKLRAPVRRADIHESAEMVAGS